MKLSIFLNWKSSYIKPPTLTSLKEPEYLVMERLRKAKREAARKIVETYFKEVIHPTFPNCNYSYATDEFIEGVHLGFGSKIQLRPYNYILKGSKYYYKKPLKFIHYTSLNNCLNILRERSFRLYNLNCLDDKFELLFAANKIFPRLSEDERKYWKSNIYSFSMCEYIVEKELKSFDTWRTYGQDGLGVGIVLTFSKKNQEDWLNRHLSRIYYDDKIISKFIDSHNKYLQKHQYPILGDHQEMVLNLCCFHKNKIYQSEKEVRYIEIEDGFDKPNADDIRLKLNIIDDDKVPIIFVPRVKDAWKKHQEKYSSTIKFDLASEIDLGKDRKTAHFKRLYLDTIFRNSLVDKTVDCPHVKTFVNALIPIVKIEKIILGYRYNEESKEDIQRVISELSRNFLGYTVPVEISKLKNFF